MELNGQVATRASLYPGWNHRADGHPFLFADSLLPAELFIRGLAFKDVPILIDLERKAVIIQEKVQGIDRYIQLADASYDSLHFVGRSFVAHPYWDTLETHFLPQVIYDGQRVALYRLYKKRFVSVYNERTPYGMYSDAKVDLVLAYEGSIFFVSKRKHLYAATSSKARLKPYFKREHLKLQTASDQALRSLMKFIEGDR